MHILVAALNWGMGHASRSVPIVRELQAKGIHISLASDGVAADLLRAEFPDLQVHELPSYKVRYPSTNIYFNVLLSAWHIVKAKRKEKLWLQSLEKQIIWMRLLVTTGMASMPGTCTMCLLRTSSGFMVNGHGPIE